MIKRNHQAKVKRISRQLKQCYRDGKKVRVYHGSTNSTRAQKFSRDGIIDTSSLNQVIYVDPKKRLALVESNVPMDQLVQETLKFNLLPPVVMEFPGITVGGGIQGGAGESSSFTQGLFHRCFLEYEVLLGDGTRLSVSSQSHRDLYYGLPASYGSLGIITAAKLKLIPAKKFVQLTYYRTQSFKETLSLIQQLTNKKVDFIDGILFASNLGVVMSGTLTDQDNLPVATFSRAFDDWFYLHAEKITRKYSKYQEIIPLPDYLFRYNRGAFWMGPYLFQGFKIPFNRLTRFILNPLLKTRALYRLLQAINVSQSFLVQDLILPKERVEKFLSYINKKVSIYPLWLCPGLPDRLEKLSPAYLNTNLAVDVGVWGKVTDDYSFNVKLNREVEKIIRTLSGRKVLYAHQYYPKDEFWQVYDRKWYQSLREKYRAERVFPDIYEKTKVSEKYQTSLIKGLLDIITSPFKLRVSSK